MTEVASPSDWDRADDLTQSRGLALHFVRLGMEVLVLVMVVLSPWFYGAVHPYYEFLLDLGVVGLLGLWAVRMALERQLTWQPCPVTLGLAGLFLLGVVQLIPWPQPVLGLLSPATRSTYQELLPTEHEQLSLQEPTPTATLPAGRTLSLYPAGTRAELFRLLAVILVFACIRNNLGAPAALQRLSIVVLVNGVFLAVFGLIQAATSPRNVIYWSYPCNGSVFGPFICRNHFAFYLNIAVGLGIGLLLLAARQQRSRGRSTWSEAEDDRSPLQSLAALLQKPLTLWIIGALALIIGAVILSLSRGGALALVGACLVCLLMRLSLSHRALKLERSLLVAVLVLGILTWFGYEAVRDRLATLTEVEKVQEGRVSFWLTVLPLVRSFPLFGTGLGSFSFVEPLQRPPTDTADLLWEHAHNDYLEALIEGGLVQLTLSLLTIGLVYRAGYRAVRRYRGRSAGSLAMGAVFAFTTVVIHSFVDFGLHIPAIALLTTIVSAQLCALGDTRPPPRPGKHRRRQHAGPAEEEGETAPPEPALATPPVIVAGRGLVPVLAVLIALTVGTLFITEGWRVERAERYRLASWAVAEQPGPAIRERQIAYLEAALRWTPENARLQSQLGELYLDWHEADTRQQATAETAIRLAQVVGASGSGAALAAGGPPAALGSSLGWSAGVEARREVIRVRQSRCAGNLQEALEHFLLARDLCPLLGRPQLHLALYGATLAQAEPTAAYRRRAERVMPHEAGVWYMTGLQDYREGQFDQAWISWRRSLASSDQYLKDILGWSRTVLTSEAIAAQVVPDQPKVLLAAAQELFPVDRNVDERRPFLERALALLAERADLQPSDRRMQGALYRSLGQTEPAIAAYRRALTQEPEQTAWRYELAELLYQKGRPAEARDELLILLAQQPENGSAQTLLKAVISDLFHRR